MWPAAQEAVKKSLNEQKHSTQRRKVAEGAKRTEQLFFASLCALASLREIVYSFTASQAVGEGALPSRYKTSGQAPPSPLPPARERGVPTKEGRGEGSLPQGWRPRTAGQERPWATILRP